MSDARFSDHFSALAAAYAAGRPGYPPAVFEFVAQAAPGNERAWDCATGNGQAAAGLAPHFQRVFATDASAEQIGNAQPRENVSYSVQLAEHTEFPDDFFDAVTVAQAMHWFRLEEFGQEAERVLRPAGVLVAFVYGFFHITPAIDAEMAASFTKPVEPYWPPGAPIAWSGYRDVVLPLEPLPSPTIPMRCRWNLGELHAYLSSWSALRYYSEEHGPGLLESALDRIAPLWGDADRPWDITMDFLVRAWRKPASA